MAYGFNDQTNATGGGNYIDIAGFYNAKVSAVSYENAKNDGSGKTVLTIKFETEDGATFRHIEWDINEEQSRSNANKFFETAQRSGDPKKDRTGKLLTMPQFQQEFVDKEYEDQGARIKHIAMAYGGGQGTLTATSYADYAQKVVTMFKSLDTSEYKPLMIVYNSKDYASLPKYAPFFGVS